MNIKVIDNRFSPSQTKAEKLQELQTLLNELYALKENPDKNQRSNSASDPLNEPSARCETKDEVVK